MLFDPNDLLERFLSGTFKNYINYTSSVQLTECIKYIYIYYITNVINITLTYTFKCNT